MIEATVQTLLKRPIQRIARRQIQQTMSLTTTNNDSFAFYPVPRNRVVRRTDESSQKSDTSSPRECFSFYPSTGSERKISTPMAETLASVAIKDAKRVRATLLKNKKNKKAKDGDVKDDQSLVEGLPPTINQAPSHVDYFRKAAE